MFTIYACLPSSSAALKHFQNQLTEYEKEEIMDYSEIWYLGLDSKKIEGSQGSPQNSGYDDEHGSYLKVKFDISYIFMWLHYFCLPVLF